MRDLVNCLNCGAPLYDDVCPYCGSTYYDLSSMEVGKSCFLKIKDNNRIIRVKVVPTNLNLEIGRSSTSYYNSHNQTQQQVFDTCSCTLDMNFICVPFNKDQNLFEVEVKK